MPISRSALASSPFALTLVVALFVVGPPPARAGLLLTVANSTAQPGGSGSFDVVLSSNGGTFAVSGFSVELAVAAGSGVRFTAVTTNTTIPYLFGTLQSSPFSFNTFPTTDFIASDSDAAAPGVVNLVSGGSFGLEHVSYLVAPGAALGPISVSIVGLGGLAPTTEIDDINNNLFAFTPTNGTITLATGATVPEPSSLVLTAISLALGLGYARTRRHRAA